MFYSLLSFHSVVPNQRLKAIPILQICVPDLFVFVFYYMKRNSQIYKRPITNDYSMPLSKIIRITTASQTFLNNEKLYCPTQIILFLLAGIKTSGAPGFLFVCCQYTWATLE